MPKHKARHNHVKVYRPQGARYANGQTQPSYQEAIFTAFVAWAEEFPDDLRIDQTVIEVVGVTGGYVATLWEIIDHD